MILFRLLFLVVSLLVTYVFKEIKMLSKSLHMLDKIIHSISLEYCLLYLQWFLSSHCWVLQFVNTYISKVNYMAEDTSKEMSVNRGEKCVYVHKNIPKDIDR